MGTEAAAARTLMIAGTNSGCGKTTVTVALIAALKAAGKSVASFKCGPDYLDPMFHRAALGVPAHNLDPFFSTPDQLRHLLGTSTAEVNIVEGVMGLYDGLGATSRASSYEVAMATGIPAVLVVDPTGTAASLGAVLTGFANFRQPNPLRGVIVNRTSPGAFEQLYRPLIEDAGLVPLGFLPTAQTPSWPSRNLGLVSAAELPGLSESIAELAEAASRNIDLAALLDLMAEPATAPKAQTSAAKPAFGPEVRIAVASDEAFCFCYAETLELLESLGAQIVPFSPIRDPEPPTTDALYLPGGYPELHAEKLAGNRPMRAAIADRVRSGMPTIAECGGFLYLHRQLDGHPMAGVIAADAHRTERLQRFGYTTLHARTDSLLGSAGSTLRCHEFHYYESTDPGCGYTAVKAGSGASYPCGHADEHLYAGFPHLYLPAHPEAAVRFVSAARKFSGSC